VSLDKHSDPDIQCLNQTRKTVLDEMLLASAKDIKWTDANPQDCLAYLKLFANTSLFNSQTESKLKQVEIAARFSKEANSQSSKNLISQFITQVMGITD